MKTTLVSCNKKPSLLYRLILTAGLLFNSLVAFANPVGGVVVGGSATISQPNSTTVQINQSSDKAVINWQSFSIAQGEVTRFVQPSAQSIAMNRVVGPDPSLIYGQIQSNGQVWLVNPAGIVFGSSARVDVAGLVATTASIKNEDFMSGNYHFVQQPGLNTAVVNQGKIRAAESGIVALVAPGVENSGIIRANLGKVALASGTEFTVDLYGDRLINLAVNAEIPTQRAVTADGRTLDDAVTNSGKIYANGGTVLMTAQAARQVVNNVINMSGVVHAQGAIATGGKGGDIILLGGNEGIVKVSGKLDASGRGSNGKGGKIVATGQYTYLSGATLLATGDAGGGEIYVGGGFHGTNPNVPNSTNTLVDSTSVLNANALVNGNGGQIAVWSNMNTWFYGNATALGGPTSGDGGFIEISGHNLGFRGFADAHSTNGKTGTILFDPYQVFVDTFPASSGTSPNADVVNGAADNQLDPSLLVLEIGTNSSVEIIASGGITINSAINTTGAGGPDGIFALIAPNITINAPITFAYGVNSTAPVVPNVPTSVNGNLVSIFLQGNQITINSPITTAAGVILVQGLVNSVTAGTTTASPTSTSSTLTLGTGGNNTWNITGSNSGTLSAAGSSAIQFANINNLVGGAGNDTFNFSGSGQLSGSINGGGGSNTLNLTNATGAGSLSLFSGNPNFIRSGGQNVLILGGFTNIQTINGATAAATTSIPNVTLPGNTSNNTNSNYNGNPLSGSSTILALLAAAANIAGVVIATASDNSIDASGVAGVSAGVCTKS